ncbi:MAG TPA: hypothetical protein VNZ22_09570, partial [Bacillota bacterium]|nr:hypothetical protein [Bacillota bacterium]
HSLMTFEQWSQAPSGDRLSLARNRLAEAQPGWGSTALDSALIQAAEMFVDQGKGAAAGERQMVVISDFQEGSRTAGLQGYQWPKGLQVLQERIASRAGNNASLQLLAEMTAAAPTTTPAIRVRVSTAGDAKQEQFRVGWANTSGAYLGQPVEVYAPAGQSRIVSLPAPATNLPVSRILLTGDDESFDNSVWTIPPEKSQVKVVYLGDDLEGDARQPLFFLQRALQDTPRQAIRFARAKPAVPLSGAELEDAALVVVTTSVEATQVAPLREVLARGTTLLFVPKSAEAAASLGKVLNTELPPATERKLEGYAMLADIDFGHPLFAPFADARFSDFTKLHFWNYRKMDVSAVTNAQTLARFDTGDSAILSIPAGKGRVVVFTSGWHPADSQLALSTKFVPLLYSLMELCNAAPPAPAQHFVGDTLPIGAAENAATPLTLQLPQGGTATLARGETNCVALEPGIYGVVSSKGTTRFAVNLEPAESRTAPMAADELDRLGVPGPMSGPVAVSNNQSKARLQNEELEARQKLWRWILVAALGLLGLETWLAGWTTRQTARTEEAA